MRLGFLREIIGDRLAKGLFLERYPMVCMVEPLNHLNLCLIPNLCQVDLGLDHGGLAREIPHIDTGDVKFRNLHQLCASLIATQLCNFPHLGFRAEFLKFFHFFTRRAPHPRIEIAHLS